MHILIIPSWYPNENNNSDIKGIFFKDLAEEYARTNHRVSVLGNLVPFPINPFKLKKFLKRKRFYRNSNVNVFNIKFINYSGYLHLGDFTSSRNILKWIDWYSRRFGKPDFIHAHSVFNGGLFAYQIFKKYQIPYIITEHAEWFMGNCLNKNKLIAKEVFNNSIIITAVSNALKESISQNYSIPLQNIKVIPNILPNEFHTNSSNIEAKEFTFLNIGLDNPIKRRDLLIEAFAKKFKGNMKIKLQIGGTIKESKKICEYAKQFGVVDQIQILGLLNRNEVKKIVSKANVFVLSSDIETFGVALIEALSQGKPIISTECGGPNDIITNENGILVPINNVKLLSEAMDKMYKDYSKYDSKKIRENCLLTYAGQHVINKYMELLS